MVSGQEIGIAVSSRGGKEGRRLNSALHCNVRVNVCEPSNIE